MSAAPDKTIARILSRFDEAIERLQSEADAAGAERAVEEAEAFATEFTVATEAAPEAATEIATEIATAIPAETAAAIPAEASATEVETKTEVSTKTEVERGAESSLLTSVRAPAVPPAGTMLSVRGLTKRFGSTVAAADVDLDVPAGTIFGIVGPNGAGKTTTLAMVTGMLRPDAGTVAVAGADVWDDPVQAKRSMGILPDRLRVFDRLTGAQLLHYAGVLRGLDADTVTLRTADLARAFGLEDSLARLVSDYSSGMSKKLALAAAIIHSPRLLVLDEPFESVDPVSADSIIRLLKQYVDAGGTVVLSSHGLGLIENICDSVAIIVSGRVLAAGSVDEVRGDASLEARLVELAARDETAEGMEWLHSFSD